MEPGPTQAEFCRAWKELELSFFFFFTFSTPSFPLATNDLFSISMGLLLFFRCCCFLGSTYLKS